MKSMIVLAYGLAVLLPTLMVEGHNSSSQQAITDQYLDPSVVRELLPPKRFLGESQEEETSGKPWGEVLFATFVVNLATLAGVIFLIPAVSRKGCLCLRKRESDEDNNLVDTEVAQEKKDIFDHDDQEDTEAAQEEKETDDKSRKYVNLIIPSFAAGALLSTIMFLVLPEGLMALQKAVTKEEEGGESAGEEEGNHENHANEFAVGAVWRFGTMLLAGFLLPVVFEAMFPRKVEDSEEELSYEGTPGGTEEQLSSCDCCSLKEPKRKVNMPLILSILIGDFLHNFCDGVFIGVAFLGCGRSTAITIMLVTLYHEIAQEIADFFLLTEHANMRVLHALFLNFLAGLSVVFGGILVLAVDVTDMFIGLILAMTSGTYFYIAACECMPRADAVVETWLDRVLTIVVFVVGAIPVGLALINHSHCDVGH